MKTFMIILFTLFAVGCSDSDDDIGDLPTDVKSQQFIKFQDDSTLILTDAVEGDQVNISIVIGNDSDKVTTPELTLTVVAYVNTEEVSTIVFDVGFGEPLETFEDTITAEELVPDEYLNQGRLLPNKYDFVFTLSDENDWFPHDNEMTFVVWVSPENNA